MRWIPALLLCAAAAAEEQQPPRIINVFDDFVHYHEACREADALTRTRKWDEMLEARHREFFDHVLYRKHQGQQRLRQKNYCIWRFWTEMAPRLGEMAKVNAKAAGQIRVALREFKRHFPDFETKAEFYITIGFTFRGKVADMGEKRAFAIGLEHFKPDAPPLSITVAHELFHLYHFETFRSSGGLYRTLWVEGLAVYASAVVVPGHRSSAYLSFSGSKMNKCHKLLPTMAAELRKHLGSSDQRLKRIYFGAENNDTEIPPEAGYYVGLLVISKLAKEIPLRKLARLDANQAWRLIEAELKRLEG